MKEKKYVGVHFDSSRNKWKVSLTVKGIKYLKTWTETEREGVILRDSTIIKHGLDREIQILKPKQ